jgi:hypothetical protein
MELTPFLLMPSSLSHSMESWARLAVPIFLVDGVKSTFSMSLLFKKEKVVVYVHCASCERSSFKVKKLTTT